VFARIAIAGLALLLAACGSDGEILPYWHCSVADRAGVVYQGEGQDEVSAMEDAMQRCEINTNGPAYCFARGCRQP